MAPDKQGRRLVRGEAASSVPLRRAFGVIELIAMTPEGLTASEISEHLNLSLATTYRLLQRLNDLGVVEGGGRNARHVVGSRLKRISQTITGSGSILELARPTAQNLADEFGMVVYLAGLFEFEAFLLLTELPGEAAAPFIHPGRQFKIHASAGGKALLAFQPDWMIRQFLNHRPLERFTDRTITEETAFLAHLDKIRAQGYAVSNGESDDGLWGMACPIREGGGTVSYAIGIITFRGAIGDYDAFTERCATRLLEAAGEIERLTQGVEAQGLDVGVSSPARVTDFGGPGRPRTKP